MTMYAILERQCSSMAFTARCIYGLVNKLDGQTVGRMVRRTIRWMVERTDLQSPDGQVDDQTDKRMLNNGLIVR